MKPEAKIEQYLRTQVKKYGGVAFKFVSPGYSGVTDRLVVAPDGVVVFVEVKAVGGKMSALQLSFERLIKSMRCNHEVVWSYEDVDKLIEKYFWHLM